MRTLLQNKAVVCALVVAALGAIGWNFRPPAPRPAAKARPPSPASPKPASIPELATVATVTPRPRTVLSNWLELLPDERVRRDPFVQARSSPPSKPRQSLPSSTLSASATNSANFILHAVIIEGEDSFAVVNRRVVRVGDVLDTWRVETIESHAVRLRQDDQRLEIHLAAGRKASTPER